MEMVVVDDEKPRRLRRSLCPRHPRIVRFERPHLFEHEPAAPNPTLNVGEYRAARAKFALTKRLRFEVI
jgi:hypothetical protein